MNKLTKLSLFFLCLMRPVVSVKNEEPYRCMGFVDKMATISFISIG